MPSASSSFCFIYPALHWRSPVRCRNLVTLRAPSISWRCIPIFEMFSGFFLLHAILGPMRALAETCHTWSVWLCSYLSLFPIFSMSFGLSALRGKATFLCPMSCILSVKIDLTADPVWGLRWWLALDLCSLCEEYDRFSSFQCCAGYSLVCRKDSWSDWTGLRCIGSRASRIGPLIGFGCLLLLYVDSMGWYYLPWTVNSGRYLPGAPDVIKEPRRQGGVVATWAGSRCKGQWMLWLYA